jgi:hypothetical protein
MLLYRIQTSRRPAADIVYTFVIILAWRAAVRGGPLPAPRGCAAGAGRSAAHIIVSLQDVILMNRPMT